MDRLVLKTIEAIKNSQEGKVSFSEIFAGKDNYEAMNQFLFFIKPEITLKSQSIQLDKILNIIFSKMKEYNLRIEKINILSADYLKKYEIITQHYGVINKLAKNAINNISESARERFKEIFGKDFQYCKVSGGFEFLQEYDEFNPVTLDYLWQNKKNKKLSAGTYCEDIKLDGEIVYLINGFHPRQIKHYTESRRSIVVFTLSGQLNWNIARNEFVGTTDPLNAKEGSLRKIFLDNQKNLGIPEISQGMNGVHLSAGPVEGLVELIRYNSNFENKKEIKSYQNFNFGIKLAYNFSDKQIEKMLLNSNVDYQGKQISVFDLTEEMDSSEVIDILKSVVK